MKKLSLSASILLIAITSFGQAADTHSTTAKNDQEKTSTKTSGNNLFIDVHDLGAGKVTFADVMAAHQKDLATEGKYGVHFIKFWVDQQNGKVYCLSTAKDSQSVIMTHKEAHGLLPEAVYEVTDGAQAKALKGEQYFIDVHTLGAGNVTAAAVAGAHEKDLAAEKKYGVNFINYWVDEKNGTIFCLSQAPDSNAVIKTHKDAHGLLPAYVSEVQEGQ